MTQLINTYKDQLTGEVFPIHPDEQVRIPFVNPHGFQDMTPIYDHLMGLLIESGDGDFQALYRNDLYYYRITATKVEDATIPHFFIVLNFGALDKQENDVIEVQYGLIESLLFMKSKQITVANALAYENTASNPSTVLRSFVQNGFLEIPQNSILLI